MAVNDDIEKSDGDVTDLMRMRVLFSLPGGENGKEGIVSICYCLCDKTKCKVHSKMD